MDPLRLTAFLDFPAETFEAGAAYWSAVTGWPRSPERGPEGEFATLVPPTGSDYLRVQRLAAGGPRVHVDVHVADLGGAVREAEGLGATVLDRPFPDVVTLRSPGGFVFCLVPGERGARPEPTRWPDGRASYVDQVCLDIPPRLYAAELDFWAGLTGWPRRDPRPGSEFGRLTPPVGEWSGQPLQLLLQRLDDDQDHVTAHLDWSASDRDAEAAAHEAAGGRVQGRFEGWTVIEDPAGMTYCVTRRQPGTRPD